MYWKMEKKLAERVIKTKNHRYIIVRKVRSKAYARNGNVHNPTVYYYWWVQDTVTGRNVGMETTLRKAKAFVPDTGIIE